MARAFVTGGNRGIGLAIAEGLIAQGHEVLIGCRDLAQGQTVAGKIGAGAVELDLCTPLSIRQAAVSVPEIDILVNNAGVLGTGSVLDDPAGFDEAMQVMVHGPMLLMHCLVPGMKERGYGRVVNVSSGWGAFSDGVAGPGAYGVAKAALNALTVASARTLPSSVKVNAMCPGWVRTRMGGMAATRSPAEGADTAIWLATLDSAGPTGGFFRNRQNIEW
ncbi:MAG: SDR family NAD(P)-dependent oxidoreductase [Pelagimonas sp.]|jgi:NAD(P)-dependent dehydrogenase (short-subunit alcohol dehydrogenase family)|nr:SDR family NAD(P)-dependent oxidoreductase [Pelagimonas sp.]